MAVVAAGDASPPNENRVLGGRATTKHTATRPTIHVGSTPTAKDGRTLEHQQQTVRLPAFPQQRRGRADHCAPARHPGLPRTLSPAAAPPTLTPEPSLEHPRSRIPDPVIFSVRKALSFYDISHVERTVPADAREAEGTTEGSRMLEGGTLVAPS